MGETGRLKWGIKWQGVTVGLLKNTFSTLFDDGLPPILSYNQSTEPLIRRTKTCSKLGNGDSEKVCLEESTLT